MQIAFSMGICMDFGLYVFDEYVGVSTPAYRLKCADRIKQLSEHSGVLIATSSTASAAEFCDQGYVLDEGRVFHHPDIRDAIAHYDSLAKGPPLPAGEPDMQPPDLATTIDDTGML